jgi:8-oxo-dGTP pyrophosphatase MutT (NUDIX family)
MGRMADNPDDSRRWKVLGRKTIHTSPWINLHQDRVQLPDGSIIEGHHVIEHPRPAVGVVPLDATGQVMLVYHDRFISQERGWEIPSGGVDAGESWEAAARRELWEESGCTGGGLVYLGRYRPTIGISNQLFVLYLAHGVVQTDAIQDTNEIAEARWFPIPEVRALIDQDAVPDGLSLTALLMAFYKGYLR